MVSEPLRGAPPAASSSGLAARYHGQIHAKARSDADLAVDLDVPPVLLDAAEDRGQAQTGPLAGRLGSEEGLEDPRLHVLGHSRAAVGHREKHVATHVGIPMQSQVARVEHDFLRLDGEASPPGHGVAGVDGQVEHDLLELAGIDLDPTQRGEEQGGEHDVLANQAPEHGLHAADYLVDVEHSRLEYLPAAEGQELARECRRAGGGVADVGQ
jgi:hypothetical protein